jgi:hypothetical protein
MFLRKRNFSFQGLATVQKKQTIKENFERRIQIIVSGSHAKEIVQGLDKSNFQNIENNNIYFVQHACKGTIDLTLDIDLSSTVSYKEPRNPKKQNKTLFQHDDMIKPHRSFTNGYTSSFTHCSQDLQSHLTTYVFIVGKDNQECETMTRELKNKLQNCSVLKWMIARYPNSTGASTLFQFPSDSKCIVSPVMNFCINTDNIVSVFLKSIPDVINIDMSTFLDHMAEKAIEEMKNKMIDELQESLHQKAIAHFKK